MASSLRALAKAYAGGQLEKAKYRTDRTAFIEAVLSGSISIKNQAAGQSPTLSSESRVRNTSDKTTLMGSGGIPDYKAMPNDVSAAENGSSKNIGLIAGAAAAIVLIIIVAVFALSGDKQAPQKIASATNQATTNTNAPVQAAATSTSPATSLVRSFLAANSWSQASIDNFLADWTRLTDLEKTALTGSIELGQLTNAIYKKLLEEKALSSIGNPETSYEKQRLLVDFAGKVGINDSRIALPEPPPTPTIP